MQYLNPSFTVGVPSKLDGITCERCVFLRGEHAKDCRYASDFAATTHEELVARFGAMFRPMRANEFETANGEAL